jgi:hypothetical protein
MNNKIELYQDGSIHRSGDKYELVITHEVIPTETSPRRQRLGVYLKERKPNPFNLQGGTGCNRVTDIDCKYTHDHDYLRELYTELVINRIENEKQS